MSKGRRIRLVCRLELLCVYSAVKMGEYTSGDVKRASAEVAREETYGFRGCDREAELGSGAIGRASSAVAEGCLGVGGV